MFAWILDGADRYHRNATLAQLPPPLRLLYRTRLEAPLRQNPPLVARTRSALTSDHDGPSVSL